MRIRRLAFGVVGLVALAVTASCSSSAGPGESIGSVGQEWTVGIPPCGTAIGSWGGVSAYSNGTCFGNLNCINCDGQGFSVHTSSNGVTAYGGAWQCVELVTRYLDKTYGIWLSNNAGSPLCNSAAGTSGLTVYGPGYNGAHPEPVPGDALVWNYGGGPGHTALVTGTSGSTINYLEQNWGNTTGYAGTGHSSWNGSNFGAPSDSLGGFAPVCWIHANANSAASCVNGNGLYCGGDGVVGNPSTLYQCTGGALTVSAVCSLGCQHEPAGVNDQCAPCPHGDGLYCGGDGVPGTTGTLYHCAGGVVAVSSVCMHGCTPEPVGQNDQCAPAPPPDAGAPDTGAADAGADSGGYHGSDSGVGDAGHQPSADGGSVPPGADAGSGGPSEPPPNGQPPASTGNTGGCATAPARGTPSTIAFLIGALMAVVVWRRRRAL
jgi:hypothetical protein